MINELVNGIKQAYRDIETGTEAYKRVYASTAQLTPQALDAVEPPAAGLPNPGAMPAQAAEVATPPQPSLLDVLAAGKGR